MPRPFTARSHHPAWTAGWRCSALLLALLATSASAQTNCPYGPLQCRRGFVWREAFPGDQVCVTPDVRAMAADDNAAAASRRDPKGPYGPDSCVPGYVWREANPSDHVCVTRQVREQTLNDNQDAATRIDPACAVPGTLPLPKDPKGRPSK